MLTILNPLQPTINIHETFFLSRNLGSLNQLGKISEGIQEFTKAPPCTLRASKLDLGSYFCCSLISSLQMSLKKIKPWPFSLVTFNAWIHNKTLVTKVLRLRTPIWWAPFFISVKKHDLWPLAVALCLHIRTVLIYVSLIISILLFSRYLTKCLQSMRH